MVEFKLLRDANMIYLLMLLDYIHAGIFKICRQLRVDFIIHMIVFVSNYHLLMSLQRLGGFIFRQNIKAACTFYWFFFIARHYIVFCGCERSILHSIFSINKESLRIGHKPWVRSSLNWYRKSVTRIGSRYLCIL